MLSYREIRECKLVSCILISFLKVDESPEIINYISESYRKQKLNANYDNYGNFNKFLFELYFLYIYYYYFFYIVPQNLLSHSKITVFRLAVTYYKLFYSSESVSLWNLLLCCLYYYFFNFGIYLLFYFSVCVFQSFYMLQTL